MPIPTPREDEGNDEFMARCMGDEVMKKDFPEQKQRVAVCMSQYRKKKDKPKAEEKTENAGRD